MATLNIPDGGLTLLASSSPDTSASAKSERQRQVIRLELPQNTIDDILKSLRNEKDTHLRLGKRPSIQYGTKSQTIYANAKTCTSELYLASGQDQENLYFTGTISHALELQKAKEATDAADEALATLSQSLSAFQKDKEMRKTQTVNLSDIRPYGSDRKRAGGRVAPPKTRFDLDKERFFRNAANQSNPASPALTAYNSPSLTATPMLGPLHPVPDKTKIRQEAIRVPFIHLLAVRSVSVKFLAQQTRSAPDDCKALAEKYGRPNRLNPDKYDLKDKTYKDLDVWTFPYPSQESRQSAIDNAISAFDRMRISWNDLLWQALLPKEERGKGKILSRLDLRKGPLYSPAPRIRVENTDESGKEDNKIGGESSLRPRSTEASKDKKLGDKEAPSKKLLDKPRSPFKASKATPGANTKKGVKNIDKKPTKDSSKFKSAEIIEDSDEDLELVDMAPAVKNSDTKSVMGAGLKPDSKVNARPTSRKSPVLRGKEDKNGKTSVLNGRVTKPSPQTTKVASNSKLPVKPGETASIINKAPAARPRGTSSPQKPSPLGSSPPTNASDFENGSSKTFTTSNSTSPTTRTESSSSSAKKAPATANLPSTSAAPSITSTSNPLKRKAIVTEPSNRSNRSNTSRSTPDSKFLAPTTKRMKPTNPYVLNPSPDVSSSSGSASPPDSKEVLMRELQSKSEKFKRYYSDYRRLHELVATGQARGQDDLQRLRNQHDKLLSMKKAIWEEDSRLKTMR